MFCISYVSPKSPKRTGFTVCALTLFFKRMNYIN